MIDMMYQEVFHAFINNTNVMTNSFQNGMVKAMQEGAVMKFSGPCYQQPIAFVAEANTSAQIGTRDQSAPEPIPLETILPDTPVFSPTPPLTSTTAQGGMTSEFPQGWDPKTGLGMPPELFNMATQGQLSSRGAPLPNALV